MFIYKSKDYTRHNKLSQTNEFLPVKIKIKSSISTKTGSLNAALLNATCIGPFITVIATLQ